MWTSEMAATQAMGGLPSCSSCQPKDWKNPLRAKKMMLGAKKMPDKR